MTGAPVALDFEWFASARDIARVMDRLKADPVAREVFAVNMGLGDVNFARWA